MWVLSLAGSEVEPTAATQNPAAEFEALIERLEQVTSRLERLPLLRSRSNSLQPPSPAPTPVSAPSPPPFDIPDDYLSDDMSVNGYQDILQVRTILKVYLFITGFFPFIYS